MTFITMRMGAIGAFVMQLSCLPAFAQALDPYQASNAIGDSATCPSEQCTLDFPVVPSGKRLAIASVSAQLGPAADSLCSFFIRKPQIEGGRLTTLDDEEVSLYGHRHCIDELRRKDGDSILPRL